MLKLNITRRWSLKCNLRNPSSNKFQLNNLLLSLLNQLNRQKSQLRHPKKKTSTLMPRMRRTRSRRNDVSRGWWSKRWKRSIEKLRSLKLNKWAPKWKKQDHLVWVNHYLKRPPLANSHNSRTKTRLVVKENQNRIMLRLTRGLQLMKMDLKMIENY